MRQLLPKVGFTAGYGGPVQYLGVLDGQGTWAYSVTFGMAGTRSPLARDSVFRALAVTTPAAFAAAVTITLLVDGVPSALAVTLPPGQFSARQAGPDVSALAGQDVTYRYEGPSLPAFGQTLGLCLEREGVGMIFGIAPNGESRSAGQGWRAGAFGNGIFEGYTTADGPVLSNTYSIDAVPGAVTGLCLRAYSGAPGAAAWQAWIRKNGVLQDGTAGSVNTTTTLTGTATVVQQAFSVPGALLDRVEVIVVRSGATAPSVSAHVGVGVAYTPTVDGTFMCCGGSNDAMPDTLSWKWMHSDQAADAPLETQHEAPIGSAGFTATGLAIERTIGGSPGHATVYTLRRDGADTPLAVTIADTAIQGSGTGTATYAQGDAITLQIAAVPGASGGQLHWGVAGALAPVASPTHRRIRRLRRAPHLSADQAEQFFAKFQLDFEAGVGTGGDLGLDPQIMLRWSDDGGQTWRGPLAVSAGQLGQFRRRAIWRRLGRGRDRVFEVTMDDPVKWALVAANLDAVKGTS